MSTKVTNFEAVKDLFVATEGLKISLVLMQVTATGILVESNKIPGVMVTLEGITDCSPTGVVSLDLSDGTAEYEKKVSSKKTAILGKIKTKGCLSKSDFHR